MNRPWNRCGAAPARSGIRASRCRDVRRPMASEADWSRARPRLVPLSGSGGADPRRNRQQYQRQPRNLGRRAGVCAPSSPGCGRRCSDPWRGRERPTARRLRPSQASATMSLRMIEGRGSGPVKAPNEPSMIVCDLCADLARQAGSARVERGDPKALTSSDAIRPRWATCGFVVHTEEVTGSIPVSPTSTYTPPPGQIRPEYSSEVQQRDHPFRLSPSFLSAARRRTVH